MMKKKVLFIREPSGKNYNGTDKYCKALYNMFRRDPEFEILPIEDYPVRKSLFFHYHFRLTPLKEAIRKSDIVHINGYTSMGCVEAFLMARYLKKKVVYTAHWHPFTYLRHPLCGSLFFHFFLRTLVKYWADRVVTINGEDTKFFRTFHKNVFQIPHWNDLQHVCHKVTKKKNMILFIGRLNDPVKGIEHLYHLSTDKYEIHCVGKGDLCRKEFKQHVNISDEELVTLISEASLLVVPSKYEAFSYVTLEALVLGTPVVMSERVRIADYLGGIKGFSVFRYGNYDDFVNSVDKTIGTDVDTESVIKIFDPEILKEKYRLVYKMV